MSDFRQLEKDAQDEIAGHEITCDPVEVLALLAENKALREDSSMRAVRSLRADCEALRKDAERYRFLRDDVSAGHVDLCIVKKSWKDATIIYLSLEQADYAIDAAMENHSGDPAEKGQP